MNKFVLTAEESNTLFNLGVPMGEATVFDEDNNDILFTLQDLLSILPKKVSDRQRIYELEISVDHYSDAWCVQYTHNTDVNNLEDSFQSAEELIDAIYAEICFLKTENIKGL